MRKLVFLIAEFGVGLRIAIGLEYAVPTKSGTTTRFNNGAWYLAGKIVQTPLPIPVAQGGAGGGMVVGVTVDETSKPLLRKVSRNSIVCGFSKKSG